MQDRDPQLPAGSPGSPIAPSPRRADRPAVRWFHRFLLPIGYGVPATCFAYWRPGKMPLHSFDTVAGRWMRHSLGRAADVDFLTPVFAGVLECLILGFLLDRCRVPRWIYFILSPFVLWVSFQLGTAPNGEGVALLCLLLAWGFYGIGFFGSLAGLLLRLLRAVRGSGTGSPRTEVPGSRG